MAEQRITPDPTALKALAHPARLRILGLLRVDGPATASQLAARMGLNSGATSYHLRQLAEHGFVVDDADRGNARERWWRAAHRTTTVPDDDTADRTARGAREAFSQAVAIVYSEQIQRAVEQQSSLPDDWRPLSRASDWSLRLTPNEAKRLSDELHAVVERYRMWDPEDTDVLPEARHYRVLLNSFPRPGTLPPDET